jgi:uncharacterized protein YceK
MKNTIKKIIKLLTFVFFGAVSFAFAAHESILNSGITDSGTGGAKSGYIQPQFTLGYPTQDRYDYANFCRTINSPIYQKLGNDVRELQNALRYQIMPSLGQTGFYGPITIKAVQIFQRQNQIYPSGYVGPQTLRSMRTLWCNHGYGSSPITPTPCTSGYTLIDGRCGEQVPVQNVSAPSVSVSISPTTFTSGQTVSLNWSSQNATTCTLNNSTVQTSGSQSIVIGTGLVSYTVSCTGQGGTSVQTISTNYTGGNTGNNQVPSLTAYTTTPNLSVGQTATINLVSSNVQSCTVNGGVYNNNSTAVNGSISVTPSVTTTYVFNCTGTSGQSVNVQVVVNVAAIVSNTPTLTVTPATQTVNVGASAILALVSTNVNACKITGGALNNVVIVQNGNYTVNPTLTTAYNITCTNAAGGSITQSATVTVNSATNSSGSLSLISMSASGLATIQLGTFVSGMTCAQYINGTINWGDGQTQTVTQGCGSQITHQYSAPGTYSVALVSNGQVVSNVQAVYAGYTGGGNTQNKNLTLISNSNNLVTVQVGANNGSNCAQVINAKMYWGDGQVQEFTSGCGANLTHTYANPGQYNLYVADLNGQNAGATLNVTVNVNVSRNFTVTPSQGPAPLAVNFTASAGDEQSLFVDLGNGAQGNMVVSGGGATRSLNYTYATPGTYTAILKERNTCTSSGGSICAAWVDREVARTTVVVSAGQVSNPTINTFNGYRYNASSMGGGYTGICQVGVVSPCNGSAQLDWITTNAVSCTISGPNLPVRSVNVSSSVNVTPTQSGSVYTLSCVSLGGQSVSSTFSL